MTKRVIEREQSIMGTIFFIFKVNTVEKVLRDFPISEKIKLVGVQYILAATRENRSTGFPTMSDTNQPVQSEKKARISKLWV